MTPADPSPPSPGGGGGSGREGGSAPGAGGGGGGGRGASKMSRSGRRFLSRDLVRRGHDSADETSGDCSITDDEASVRVLLKCMGFRVEEERKCSW